MIFFTNLSKKYKKASAKINPREISEKVQSAKIRPRELQKKNVRENYSL